MSNPMPRTGSQVDPIKGPWIQGELYVVDVELSEGYTTELHDDSDHVVAELRGPFGPQQAKEIVLAVNNHSALLEALRDLHDEADYQLRFNVPTPNRLNESIGRAHALLQRIEKGG